VSSERWIDIPEPIRDVYALWRPTPLLRAVRLEKALQTPANIYYKYEGVSPAGSHKPNTAVPQAYYNKQEGVKRITTETGAGQWGSALAMACNLFGMECEVYMVRISYEQKPYRKLMMRPGAPASTPARATDQRRPQDAGEDPDCPGSLGIAISEASSDTPPTTTPSTRWAACSTTCCLHQTVIGQEAIKQMEMAGDFPDVVIGCPAAAPTSRALPSPSCAQAGRQEELSHHRRGADLVPEADQGRLPLRLRRHGRMTPLLMMHTLGHTFMPPRSTPAGCAITAWRPWSATPTSWA
jgi:tryptophan synthase beta chain